MYWFFFGTLGVGNSARGSEYSVKPEAAAALEGELRRLRALGLIEGFGIRDFAKADGKRRCIGDKFHLTSRGEEYLAMRRQNRALDAAAEHEGPQTVDPSKA